MFGMVLATTMRGWFVYNHTEETVNPRSHSSDNMGVSPVYIYLNHRHMDAMRSDDPDGFFADRFVKTFRAQGQTHRTSTYHKLR